MGDASDYADVERFARTPEGKRALEQFRLGVLGKTISDVKFCHLSTGVSTTLHFADGGHLDLTVVEQAFSIQSLRDRYRWLLDREYYVDFPERDPNKPPKTVAPAPVSNFAASAIEQLACPSCSQTGAFAIETWQSLTFHRDGTVTEGDEGQQWNDDSPCRCEGCDHEGVVRDFLAGDEP